MLVSGSAATLSPGFFAIVILISSVQSPDRGLTRFGFLQVPDHVFDRMCPRGIVVATEVSGATVWSRNWTSPGREIPRN